MQLPAQLSDLRRAAAELRLKLANMSRQVPVLIDGRAKQPLRLRGSSGYDDARLMRRDLGAARKGLPVAANEYFPGPSDQSAKPLAERRIGVRLKQVPGHSEAHHVRRFPGGAITTRGRNP
jgi:hypothetical protein